MAKILKSKVKRVRTGARVQYTYPPEYDATKINVIGMETMQHAAKFVEVDARAAEGADGYEYMLGVVSDADAPAFLASADIVEVTRAAAIVEGDTWMNARTVIQDDNVIIGVLDKVSKSEVLSKEDEDAIDPTNAVVGLTTSPDFTDRVDVNILAKDA
jgi:hypothetical protein